MSKRNFRDREDVYIESQIIMTTVRLLTPFTLVYGFFLTFHGANAPGGAFQGGTVVGATILMIAFAFGIAHTKQWAKNSAVTGLMTGGAIFLGLLGFSSMLFGKEFLSYQIFYELGLKKGLKWGIESMEIGGIFLVVAGTVIGLFFATAAGMKEETQEEVAGNAS